MEATATAAGGASASARVCVSSYTPRRLMQTKLHRWADPPKEGNVRKGGRESLLIPPHRPRRRRRPSPLTTGLNEEYNRKDSRMSYFFAFQDERLTYSR